MHLTWRYARVPRTLGEVLVGREGERELMTRALTRAASGVTTLVVVEGDAGLGKTTRVSTVAEQARDLGFTTMFGSCDELEADRPFGGLLGALGVSQRRGALDPARRELLDLLASAPDLASPIVMAATPDLRTRMIDSICALVELEALDNPVALIIEDLHWADPSTVLAIRSVARRVEGYPLLIVATSRNSAGSQHREGDVLWNVASERIVLQPLPPADVHAVAVARLGSPPGPRLREIIDGAGGNPLVLTELLDGLQQALVPSGAELDLTDGVPVTFAAGVQRRM